MRRVVPRSGSVVEREVCVGGGLEEVRGAACE